MTLKEGQSICARHLCIISRVFVHYRSPYLNVFKTELNQGNVCLNVKEEMEEEINCQPIPWVVRTISTDKTRENIIMNLKKAEWISMMNKKAGGHSLSVSPSLKILRKYGKEYDDNFMDCVSLIVPSRLSRNHCSGTTWILH